MRAREDAIVLIPAAGRVPDGVLSLSNISCPAMIPVAGRPVIHWTLGYLTSLGFKRFLIAVPSRVSSSRTSSIAPFQRTAKSSSSCLHAMAEWGAPSTNSPKPHRIQRRRVHSSFSAIRTFA